MLVEGARLLDCLYHMFASAGLEGRIRHGCLVAGTAAEIQSEARSEAWEVGVVGVTQAAVESNQSPKIICLHDFKPLECILDL